LIFPWRPLIFNNPQQINRKMHIYSISTDLMIGLKIYKKTMFSLEDFQIMILAKQSEEGVSLHTSTSDKAV
jgi:hypothetical protein